jgi:hypothetical protein
MKALRSRLSSIPVSGWVLVTVLVLTLLWRGFGSSPAGFSDGPVMTGDWSNAAAEAYVISRLQDHGDARAYGFAIADDQDATAHHYIYDYYPLQTATGEYYLVVAYTKPKPFECDACAPRLSFFEFRKTADGWTPAATSIGAYSGGSAGSPPAAIHPVRIGRDRFGIAIESPAAGFGSREARFTLYANVDGAFQRVFSVVTERKGAMYDERIVPIGSWRVNIVPRSDTDNPFYDIQVNSVDGPELSGIPGLSDRKRYRFDGKQYVLVE